MGEKETYPVEYNGHIYNLNRKKVNRLINIGESGLILITFAFRGRAKTEIREIYKGLYKDFYKEVYTEDFIIQLKDLKKEVKQWEDG